jgi:TolA-binding protein
VEAVEAHLRVYSKYPDCDAGPRSLYAAAWLSDNVTSSKDLAHFLYRKVCEKYPASAHCEQAAKPRLRAAMDSMLIARERALESEEGQHQ